MNMKLFLSLVITLAVGGIAGFATATAISTWYVHLNKPSFNPPNVVFAPVWAMLYIFMGIALYLVWKLPASTARNIAMRIFFVQLLLNFIWSIIFFNMHQLGWALIDIILLWLFIFLTMRTFVPLSKPAGWLLFPYFLWVSFASVLNFSIWQLN